MSIIILDLDNTVADDAWRIPRINWQKSNPDERYHDYHLLAAFDDVGNRHLFEGVPHDIVVFTARPVAYAALTMEWLSRNGIVAKHVLMRNPGDYRHSRDLKMTQLRWLLDLYDVQKHEIVCAYDDRQDVVDAFRANGIAAECCPIHNQCAYTDPTARALVAAGYDLEQLEKDNPFNQWMLS